LWEQYEALGRPRKTIHPPANPSLLMPATFLTSYHQQLFHVSVNKDSIYCDALCSQGSHAYG